MQIRNVRFVQHIPLGNEISPENYLERGRKLASSRVVDIRVYDSMFLQVDMSADGGTTIYTQLVPWSQVASVYLDYVAKTEPQGESKP